MINYIIRLAISAVIIYLMPKYLAEMSVDSVTTALIVAVVMSILNTFVKPILNLIALPINFFTLGLFSLVITIGLVQAADYYVNGFEIQGFFTPLIFSLVLSVVNSAVSLFQG